MDLQQLRYLRAVVRSGSVTRAAEQEHVAQPSVSKQVRAMERELGVALLHRVGRRVVPTEAGMRLADCADRLEDDLRETVASLAGPGGELGRRLSICATETLTNHLLPPALAALRARYPAVRVSVEMTSTDEAVARVLDDAVDFALIALPFADSRLEVRPLRTEDVLLAVPSGHAWAGAKRASLAEALADPSFLFSMPGHGLRAQVEAAARELGVAIDPRVELRSQQAILSMVAAGAGIGLAPRLALTGREDVIGVPLEPPLSRQTGWIRRPGRNLPATAYELIALAAVAG
ncbi:MAG: LysR family transcriptional regulator [Chloroflexi bacterium]|nr:LysR family transcriptional regulator [Chloroflexota bacterium]